MTFPALQCCGRGRITLTTVTAFNLLNDIDLEKTEARIAEFMQKNAKSIAANKQKAQRELLSLNEREEEIKRDKDLWRKQIEQSEIFEEREEQRVKREIVEAMVSVDHFGHFSMTGELLSFMTVGTSGPCDCRGHQDASRGGQVDQRAEPHRLYTTVSGRPAAQ